VFALAALALWYYGRDAAPARNQRTSNIETPLPTARDGPAGVAIDDVDVAIKRGPQLQHPREDPKRAAGEFTIKTAHADGAPVAGIRLLVKSRWNHVDAVTDVSGVAHVTVAEPDTDPVTEVVITSSARTYMTPPVRRVGPAENLITFVLERSGRAAGQLVGPDRKPLRIPAGIDVRRGEQTLVSTFARSDGTFLAYVPMGCPHDVRRSFARTPR
jgi:hypothetical protein